MPVLVMCSNSACSELFDAPDEAVGRKVRCPSCGTVQDVRAAAPQLEPGSAGRVRFAETVEPEAPPPPPAPPASPAGPTPTPPPVASSSQAKSPEAEFLLEVESASVPAAKLPPAPPRPLADDEPMDLIPLSDSSGTHRPAGSVPAISGATSKAAPGGAAPSFRATAPKVVGGKGGAAATPAQAKPSDEMDLVAADGPGDEGVHQGPAAAVAPPPAPSGVTEGDIRFSSLLDEASTTEAEGPVTDAISDGLLEHKWAEMLIFALGLGGMAVGLALGLIYLLDYPYVLRAYIGGVLGWVAGFTLAFLIVLVADKSEAPKVHCPVCQNVFPAETELCQWCGSPLATPTFNPLAFDCLYAGSYATSNVGGIILMSLLVMVTAVVDKLMLELPAMMPSTAQIWPGLLIIGGLLTAAVLAYFVAFLLRAVRETASRSRAAPDLPPIADPQNIVNLLKFLLLCLIYIGPIFTIPLVPLGLLGLAAPGTVSPFNLRGMSGVLGRHAKDFVILWLLLLLWGAALVLALALLAVARILVGDWMPHLQGSSLTALEFVGLAVGSFVTAGLVSIFGLCLCRCVGMFGRHNANILTPARDAKQNPSPNPPGPLQSSV